MNALSTSTNVDNPVEEVQPTVNIEIKENVLLSAQQLIKDQNQLLCKFIKFE